MARRHLGFGADEWCRLPWWQSRLYEEGLVWEFTPADGEGELDSPYLAPVIPWTDVAAGG